MANRVTTQDGKLPVLIVAPHGHRDNDFNTDIISDVLASELRAYAVINVGWARGPKAVLGESIANLNDIQHCKLGPCKREFLDPLVAIKDEIIAKHERCHIFYIHGMHNNVRTKVQDDVDIVMGYGQGDPPSHTCSLLYKNALCTRLREEKFNVYQAKLGGRFAAWRKDNLNQLFRQHTLDQRVNSIQLEIINNLRDSPEAAVEVGLRLVRSLDKFLHQKTTYQKNISIKEC